MQAEAETRGQSSRPERAGNLNKRSALRDAWQECWGDFCEQTTFNGVKYLRGRGRGWGWGRVFWSIVLLVSCTVASVLIYYLWLRYMVSPTRTTIRSQHVPNTYIPFPAVTICPPTMVSPGRVEAVAQKFQTSFNKDFEGAAIYRAINQIASTFDRRIASRTDLHQLDEMLNASKLSAMELLRNVSFSCGELLGKCLWNDELQECGKVFAEVLTSEGFCCSANYQGSKDHSHPPFYSKRFGFSSGLSLIAYTPPAVSLPQARTGGKSTFRLFIHDPLTFPTLTADNFILAPERETAVALDITRVVASENLKELTRFQRKCVFRDEYSLGHFSAFTHENCITDCQISLFKRLCGCVPLFLKMGGELCRAEQYLCLVDHFEKVLNIGSSTDFSSECNCPSECDLVIRNARLSQWDIQDTKFSVNPLYENIALNSTIVHIYLAKSHSVVYSKVISMRGINFVSYLGGLTSFFLGCSLISMVEILYFLCYRLRKAYSRTRMHTQIFYLTPLYWKCEQFEQCTKENCE